MLSFIKKIIIFLLPLSLLFVLPAAFELLTKDYLSSEQIVKIQSSNPSVLYGADYDDGEFYKKNLIKSRNPEIVTIGSSKVLQFRQELFIHPEKFTNAGSSGAPLGQIKRFISELPPDTNIKVIFLGLDEEMFVSATSSANLGITKESNVFESFAQNWEQIYIDYFNNKFSFKDLWKEHRSNNIGKVAILNNNGFRSDGSYEFSTSKNSPNHKTDIISEVSNSLYSLNNDRSSGGYYGSTISDEALDSVQEILNMGKEKGIYIIGILPPIPQLLYKETIQKNDSYSNSAIELPIKLSELFSKNNLNFYDFSNISVINATDTEFVDIKHGTDKMALRMILYMAEHDPKLKSYIDTNKLNLMLKNSHNDFLDF